MKKFLLIFFSIFLCSFVFSDSIENYRVLTQVPLNQNLTIYGEYHADVNVDVLCAAYIFDIKNLDVNVAVVRLKDQYTFSDGSFYNQIKIEEPLFQRGIDYNAITKCGTTETGAVFSVAQKEDIVAGFTPASISNDIRFWVDSNNQISAILLLFGALVFAVFIALILSALGIHL
jgi:hypothetical protein